MSECSGRRNVLESRALIYPRCFLKRKIGGFLSLFFKEIVLLSPSETKGELWDQGYFEGFPLKITPWVPVPMGDAAGDLEAGIKALTAWGEQLGLGKDVSFETFYSAINSSQDGEVKAVMEALRGSEGHDLLAASRAFLALSCEADRREDELEAEMERVEEQARKISELVEDSSLLPEGDGPVCFIRPVSKARERMRAWARLAFSAATRPEAWPVGESIEVKDLMDAAYESLTGGISALDVLDVSLPLDEALLKDPDVIFKTRSIFSDILSTMADTCHRPALTANEEFFELSKALADALDSDRWKQAKGPRLVLTLYPGHSWTELVARAARIDAEEQQSVRDEEQICASFFIL